MAYDYNKVKEQYEKLNDQQKQSFANDNSWYVQDFLKQYNAEKSQSSTPITTTTQNNTTATVKPEYQWTWSSNVKQSSYTNQWAGNYSYNPTSWYYEKQWWTTTSMNQSVADKWNSMSYDEQQEKLKANPNLQNNLTKLWLTNKTAETPTTTWTTTWTTPEKTTTWATPSWQWDYQDDSPERMAQIAQNLEGYKQTMPYLFNDKKAFDDFFINWVNRSQAQIDFLNDWFYKNQKYSKYDGLTPDSVWYWIAYGDIPEDYLSMLKTTDPAKYQAALQAKQDAEDKIKNKANLGSIMSEAGLEDTSNLAWQKKEWLFMDANENWVDDRRENYASEEEQWYLKQISDLNAANLDIDNTVKHTYEDLVEKYPWATKATLMAMAQDINSDLLREKENNLVELTRLQWYVWYMQSERQEMNAAGADSIAQLQKNLWMYYQYSPQWISELYQAQYAATNVTLTQADNWTYTQKQIAVDDVLTPYYENYWDILFTSKAEAINQAINYAQENWVSLQTALDETFYKQLYSNPYYLQRVSWDTWWYGKWEVIWEDELWNKIYWFVNTTTWVVVPYWNVAWWWYSWWYGWYTTWAWTWEWWYIDVPRTWNNVWADTNNFGNITSLVDGAIWMYHSPNGRDYAVFATAEDWYNALVRDLQWKQSWNTRTWLNWNSTVAELIWTWVNGSWTVDPSNYYAKAFTKATWLSLNDKIWNVSADKLAKWIMAWEWTLDAYNKWWKDLTAYAWQTQPQWATQPTTKFDKNMANVYAEYSSAKEADKTKIASRYWKSRQQMDAEVYEYEWWKNAQDLSPLLDVVERLLNWSIEIPWQYQRMDTAWIDFWLNWFVPWTIKESNRNWMKAHNYIYNTLWMESFLDLKSKGATFWALSEDERQAIYDAATMFGAELWDEEYKRQLRLIEKKLKEAWRWYLDNYVPTWSSMDEAVLKLWLVKSTAA